MQSQTVEHSQRAHSQIGASSAYRWTQCPGSVGLLEQFPMPTNAAAEYGTQAHELSELMLNGSDIVYADYDDEMRANIREYVDWIETLEGAIEKQGAAPERMVESRFRLNSVSPEAYGTNDVALYVDFGVLHVIDLKYGHRFVSPKENPQLMYYALGVIEEHDLNPTKVVLWIYGPRMSPDQPAMQWDCPMARLNEFHEELKTAAKRVDSHPNEFKIGDHCFYCNKAECPKVNEKMLAAFDDIEPAPAADETGTAIVPLTARLEGMSTDELVARLKYKDLFKGAFSDMDAILKQRAEAGESIPGRKLVMSYGHRSWKDGVDEQDVLNKCGVKGCDIYAPRKMLTAPQMEKVIKHEFKGDKDKKKEKLEAFNTLVEKPERGSKLVHEDQPGEPVQPAALEFDDIEDIDAQPLCLDDLE